MKAFVTGGTGFIGQHVVRKLLLRGYDVHALVRAEAGAEAMRALGANPVIGDITDMESMRAGMTGSDIVFHIAGWYKYGDDDWMKAEMINVGGTRKVLRLAYELGVPKIIYTSTVAVFGDTKGEMVDETYHSNGPFLTEYDRTKWLAHYKVAIPLIEKGAPIIIVMPGGVFGPGDPSWIAELMRLYYRGVPMVPGPESVITWAHVEDVAEGHILAAEKGRIGESYILAGPAVSLGEMVDFWSYITGKRPAGWHVPARALRPMAPAAGLLQSALPLPSLFSRELTTSLGATYKASADKARTELGWETRALQSGMHETFEWIAATTPAGVSLPLDERQKKAARVALLAALALFLLWLLKRREKGPA
jgi:nucleoside-diphosphate-sugar epimerase